MDIVARLRKEAQEWAECGSAFQAADYHAAMFREAADEIERLRTAVFAAATAAGQERLAAQNARQKALEEAAAVAESTIAVPFADGQSMNVVRYHGNKQVADAIRALSAVEKGTE